MFQLITNLKKNRYILHLAVALNSNLLAGILDLKSKIINQFTFLIKLKLK